MCLQDDTPPPQIISRNKFYLYNLNFLEFPVLSSFDYPHHFSRSVMFLAYHALGACMNLQCTVYIPGHNVNRKLIREIIFFA